MSFIRLDLDTKVEQGTGPNIGRTTAENTPRLLSQHIEVILQLNAGDVVNLLNLSLNQRRVLC